MSNSTGRILVLAALALSSACATAPASISYIVLPGIRDRATGFEISDPTDELSRAAVPFIDTQLRRLGYFPSSSPDLLVTISASEHERAIGTFGPDGCSPTGWIEPPAKRKLFGGGRVLRLQVSMIDFRTGRPVYRSSASIRVSSGQMTRYAAALTAAALGNNPRRAAPRQC